MITALALVSWISIGGMQYDLFGPYKLPMSTENCPPLNNNSTVLLNNITQETSSNSTMIRTAAVTYVFVYECVCVCMIVL